MRQGGDGMPVGGVKMSEGPCEVGEAQPAGHAIGAINVMGIIVTDPIEVRGLPKDNPDQRDKREGDQKFLRLQTEAQTIHGAERCESTTLPAVVIPSAVEESLIS